MYKALKCKNYLRPSMWQMQPVQVDLVESKKQLID